MRPPLPCERPIDQMKTTTTDTTTNDSPDFEEALQELESLVTKLETGDLSLDQSLACFKRGVALTRHCQTVLDEAQKTIEQLDGVDAIDVPGNLERSD